MKDVPLEAFLRGQGDRRIRALLASPNRMKPLLQKMSREALTRLIEEASAVLEQLEKEARFQVGEKGELKLERLLMMKRQAVQTDSCRKDAMRRRREENAGRYMVVDSNGYARIWDGLGRPPVQFQQAFAAGYVKDECLTENKVTLDVAFDRYERTIPLDEVNF